jgi:hypothetical protein
MLDDMDDKKAALEELMQFARGGMAKDMRARHGKPPDPEPAPEDLVDGGVDDAAEGDAPPPEDPEIPGVEGMGDEPLPDGGADGADAGGDTLPPELLQALLAKMKAKGG